MPVPLDHHTAVPDSSPSPTVDKPTGRPSKQWPMVGWYQPSQLIRTGIAVLISTIFGRHSDHRLVEALGTNAFQIYDYTCDYHQDTQGRCEPDLSRPRQELWFDYVGDVGDGWHSTYAIAYALAQEKLHITKATNGGHYNITIPRGALLIFGGDEVYPTASQEAYEQRLVGPYATALRKTEASASPHIFAIPGNHDWYDSLASFIRLFTSRRWFGGWRTRQTRSYFALRLPQKWWLLGTDVQLGSDIDRPQVQYFEDVAQEIERLDPGARIILCHAEPHWVYKQMYQGMDPAYSESNLALLEKRLGKDVSVFIAGDQHHYRRYETEDGTQKITSGGGGAFLHPTHTGRWGRDLRTITEEASAEHGVQSGRTFRQVTCFPSEDVSRKLCWRTLIFPYLRGNASWSFGLVTALFYWLSTLALLGNVERFPLQPSAHAIGPVSRMFSAGAGDRLDAGHPARQPADALLGGPDGRRLRAADGHALAIVPRHRRADTRPVSHRRGVRRHLGDDHPCAGVDDTGLGQAPVHRGVRLRARRAPRAGVTRHRCRRIRCRVVHHGPVSARVIEPVRPALE